MQIFKNGIKLGLTIIGTTIGAGFASGREIWEFFSSYGIQSFIGILIALLLFAITSIFILIISYEHKTENYYEILIILMGKKLAKIFDIFIFLYLFSGSIIMFAGSGATFEQLSFPYYSGVLLLAIFVWIVIIKGVEGLLSMNSILIPSLIVILIYVNYQFLIDNKSYTNFYLRSHLEVWPSALTYASLNLVSLLGVLSTMGKKITSIREVVFGGVFSSIVLGLVALTLNSSLLRIEYVQQYEIPLFSLIPLEKHYLLIIVSIVLWFAIYTTVLSNVYGIVYRLQSIFSFSTSKISLIIIISLIPLAFIGFSTLVEILYPLYGVLNLYLLSVLILYPFQMKK